MFHSCNQNPPTLLASNPALKSLTLEVRFPLFPGTPFTVPLFSVDLSRLALTHEYNRPTMNYESQVKQNLRL